MTAAAHHARHHVRRALGAVALGLSLFLVAPEASVTLAASDPDKGLYEAARSAEGRLRKSRDLQASRAEWEKVVLAYRKVVARYPRSGYCDDALLAVGRLYGEMAERFRSDRYRSDAMSAYRMIVSEYPSSRLGDEALWAVVKLERDTGSHARLVRAGQAYLATFPRGAQAAKVKRLMQQKSPSTRVPSPPPPGLARVFDLRFWTGDTSTRVVLDLEAKVDLRYDRVGNPERLWIDLIGTRLHPNLEKRVFPVGDGLLERVRIAQNRPEAVRVVLDFKGSWEHNLFYLDAPPRLVIDVNGRGDAADRKMAEGAASGRGTSAPSPGSGPGTSSASRVPPEPPAANRDGNYSLARQLGLGAKRIVIDPGHGGHDPGTIGRKGLREKDLVLDVSLRLARMIRAELGAEVLMTRSEDVFVRLDERTAIANTKDADLFLSIHANGVRSSRAEGIETYFLSFARSSHAEAVAARENAISERTLKDLQGLIQKIALPTKIDESRDFATSVQEAMIKGARRQHEVRDRGVHTAPFYVLIGARMPAVLAEIGFVSNPEGEKRLRTAEYRDTIARSLLVGVRSYLNALSRTQTRQLTRSGQGSRVVDGGKSR